MRSCSKINSNENDNEEKEKYYKHNPRKVDKEDVIFKRIQTPHPNDVLFGRGGSVFSHNKSFRQLANERMDEYELDKSGVVKEITHVVQTQNPPGRFLTQEPTGSKHWIEVDNILQ